MLESPAFCEGGLSYAAGQTSGTDCSFWVLRGRFRGRKAHQGRDPDSCAGSAVTDSGAIAGAPRPTRHPGGDPTETLVVRHVCGVRRRIEYGGAEAARGIERFG